MPQRIIKQSAYVRSVSMVKPMQKLTPSCEVSLHCGHKFVVINGWLLPDQVPCMECFLQAVESGDQEVDQGINNAANQPPEASIFQKHRQN